MIELSSQERASPEASVFQRALRQWVVRVQGWIVRDGLVVLLFALLALVVMSSVLPDPRSRIMGWEGDNIQYVYMTGWSAQALLLGHLPFVDPRLNYPDDLLLSTTDFPYLGMLAVAPATLLLGPVAGYNLLIWLNVWLSGYIAYLWVRQITGSRAAALIAGLAFLLMPYRLVHAYGHLQMVSTFALPLFFWALDSALRAPRPSWRNLLLPAGATLLVGGSSQYYLVMCLLLGIIYALLILLSDLGSLLRRSWRPALGIGLGALLSALPYLLTLQETGYTAYAIEDTRMWSASPLNFVLPSMLHPWWGSLVEQLYAEPLWIEKTLYVGSVAAALALLALLWRGSPYARWARIWAVVAVVAAALALGTDLHLTGEPVQHTDPFWLPAYYLAHLPGMSFVRVWARFGIITILFVALLAGIGTALLLQRYSCWRWHLLTPLVALVLIDGLPGMTQTIRLAPRPVDAWLAQQPDDFAVGVLPANNDAVLYRAMYGSLFHGKHLPAYNHPAHQPAAYKAFARQAATFPDQQAVHSLHALGLRYVLLDKGAFDGQQALQWYEIANQLEQSSTVSIVAEWEDIVVVELH